jgi:hypothetical protein
MQSQRKKIVEAPAGGWEAGLEVAKLGCYRPKDPETVPLA